MLTVSEILSKEIWDKFLVDSRTHSFLHSWTWGDLNAPVVRMGVYQEDKIIAVFIAIIVKARRGTFVLCPHGPVIDISLDSKNISELMTVITDELRKIAKENKASWIRIAPILEDSEENRNIFKNLGYKDSPLHVHPEYAWRVNLEESEDKILSDMRKTTRYSIKKAMRDGVTTSISTDAVDIEKFWNLYSITVDRQNFTPFPRSLIENEFKNFAKENFAFWVFAHEKGELLAGALIILSSEESFYHHGASVHHPTASYLVQWSAMMEAKKRGKSWYNFWGVWPDDAKSTFGKTHPQSGLSQFKKGFGGIGESYVHAQDLPLNSRYWINYVVEYYRRIRRGF